MGQIILDVNEVTQKDSVLMIKGYDIDQLIGLMDEQAEVEPSCIAFDLAVFVIADILGMEIVRSVQTVGDGLSREALSNLLIAVNGTV